MVTGTSPNLRLVETVTLNVTVVLVVPEVAEGFTLTLIVGRLPENILEKTLWATEAFG